MEQMFLVQFDQWRSEKGLKGGDGDSDVEEGRQKPASGSSKKREDVGESKSDDEDPRRKPTPASTSSSSKKKKEDTAGHTKIALEVHPKPVAKQSHFKTATSKWIWVDDSDDDDQKSAHKSRSRHRLVPYEDLMGRSPSPTLLKRKRIKYSQEGYGGDVIDLVESSLVVESVSEGKGVNRQDVEIIRKKETYHSRFRQRRAKRKKTRSKVRKPNADTDIDDKAEDGIARKPKGSERALEFLRAKASGAFNNLTLPTLSTKISPNASLTVQKPFHHYK
ncbi:hypothetical protein HDU67_004505, partial [Dinochytrium kinnereticum]